MIPRSFSPGLMVIVARPAIQDFAAPLTTTFCRYPGFSCQKRNLHLPALHDVANDHSIHIVLLRGEGRAFCAGFDLPAALEQPDLMEQFIERLSGTLRAVRRLPHVVVAAVQGGAIAGGCALVTACDFVMASPDAKFGYPVHRLGISPAVTIPTLQQTMGPGHDSLHR